jgi:hypothetical protein
VAPSVPSTVEQLLSAEWLSAALGIRFPGCTRVLLERLGTAAADHDVFQSVPA